MEVGTAWLPLAWHQHFHSGSGPRFSLKQQIAFTPPVCVFVHLGGKQAPDRFPPCQAEGQDKIEAFLFSRLIPERSCGWGLFCMVGLGIFNQVGLKTNNAADCGLSSPPCSLSPARSISL